MFGNSLSDEYVMLETHLNFSKAEIIDMIIHSIHTSWLEYGEKELLVDRFKKEMNKKGPTEYTENTERHRKIMFFFCVFLCVLWALIKKEEKMTEPTCPKCEGHYFKKKYFDGVYIVYCDKCGHIIGCVTIS